MPIWWPYGGHCQIQGSSSPRDARGAPEASLSCSLTTTGTRILYSSSVLLRPPLPPSGLIMQSLLSLVGPLTLIISLIGGANAMLDVANVANVAPHDFIDANGLPVDMKNYSWGGYAKKRNTAVRATQSGVLHHSSRGKGKHAQLLSRQVVVYHPFKSCCTLLIPLVQQAQCPLFQTACLQGSACCPNTKICEYRWFFLLMWSGQWSLLLTTRLQAASASLKALAAILVRFASE